MTWLQNISMKDDASSHSSSQVEIESQTAIPVKPSTCPLCSAAGKTSKLRLFQINLSEAVLLCSTRECTYPLGVRSFGDLLVERDASAAVFSKKRKNSSPCSAQPAKLPRLCDSSSRSRPALKSLFPEISHKVTVPSKVNESKVEKLRLIFAQTSKNKFQSYVRENNNPSVVTADILKKVKSVQSTRPDKPSMYPQWSNSERSCWLDAVLCFLVHSKHLQDKATTNHLTSNILDTIKSYRVAQLLCKQKTQQFCGVLAMCREKVWNVIQERIKCVRGKADSASCGLMALLHSEPQPIQKLCTIPYHLKAACDKCTNQQNDELEKRVITFGEVPSGFTMSQPHQQHTCEKCHIGTVNINIHIKQYPSVLLGQFIHGLPGKQLVDYDFSSVDGTSYMVRAVVQYKHDPDHFVAWIHDLHS